uniref:Sugar transferase n=1 Tax=Litorilinea aerophila TaxID=1204385 RepID=A0A540VFV7_9CHLR
MALLVGDGAMLLLAFALAYWLRFQVGITVSPEVTPVPQHYIRLVLILIPLWLPLFSLLRLYDFHYLLGGTAEYAQAFNATTSGMMIVILASFVDPSFRISRAWLLMSWLLSTGLICGNRFLLRRLAYAQWRRSRFLTPTLIVGTNQEAMALAAKLRESVNTGLAVLGFVSTDGDDEGSMRLSALDGLPVLGNMNALPRLIQNHHVGEIVVASTALSRDQLTEVFRCVTAMPQVEIRLSSGLYEILTTGMRVTRKGDVPLMSLNRLRLDPLESFLKAALDYTLIFFSLPVLVPLFAVVAVLIKLDSPGPVFYRRRVLGVGGKEFDAFKFRTMAVNGDEILARYPQLQAELQATHKLKYDPRVTRMGRWLRRTSLDELPQLINVLLGQMSLVGPRMISPEEADEYGRLKLNLLTVKPGLTGLWQVSGRSDLSYEERVRLDMQYIRNYSIWLDLQILFVQTIPVVLQGRGAY